MLNHNEPRIGLRRIAPSQSLSASDPITCKASGFGAHSKLLILSGQTSVGTKPKFQPTNSLFLRENFLFHEENSLFC
jgi:hypothetical protein